MKQGGDYSGGGGGEMTSSNYWLCLRGTYSRRLPRHSTPIIYCIENERY